MSEQSESIGKLALALSKLQGEIQNIFADKKGYNYTYVDLASILEISRPLLAKHELALLQTPCNPKLESGIPDPNIVGVKSILMHSSGEYISETAYMQVVSAKGMNAAQAAGSVITYARRYAFAAMLGIAQTDNDAANDSERVVKDVSISMAPSASEQAYVKLVELIDSQGLNHLVDEWLQYFKVKSLSALSETQMHQLMNKILIRNKTQAEQLASQL